MKVSPKQYAQALYDITEGKSRSEIKKTIADFARYLCKEGKLKLVDKIVEQFAAVYNKKKGIIETEIVSRKKLSEIELKKVKHFIKDKYQAKEVVLKNSVDENVKGGIILKVGDEVIDGSIAGKLDSLKKILVA